MVPPAGLTALESDIGQSSSSQGSQSWYRSVQAGDGTSWSFTGATNYVNVAVFEISGAVGVGYSNGPMTGASSATIVTGALAAAVDPNSLRLLVAEWDSSDGVSSVPSGWTQLSPSTWLATSTGTHDAGIWQIPASTTGTKSIALTAATDSSAPIYLDLRIETVTTAFADQSLAEVVAQNPSPPGTVAQAMAEVIAQNPSPPAHAGQLFMEIIVSTSLFNSYLPVFIVC